MYDITTQSCRELDLLIRTTTRRPATEEETHGAHERWSWLRTLPIPSISSRRRAPNPLPTTPPPPLPRGTRGGAGGRGPGRGRGEPPPRSSPRASWPRAAPQRAPRGGGRRPGARYHPATRGGLKSRGRTSERRWGGWAAEGGGVYRGSGVRSPWCRRPPRRRRAGMAERGEEQRRPGAAQREEEAGVVACRLLLLHGSGRAGASRSFREARRGEEAALLLEASGRRGETTLWCGKQWTWGYLKFQNGVCSGQKSHWQWGPQMGWWLVSGKNRTKIPDRATGWTEKTGLGPWKSVIFMSCYFISLILILNL